MRTTNQINNIKKRISDPYEVKNFLTNDQILHLINLFETNLKNLDSPVVYKNTGPVTLDLNSLLEDSVINKILEDLKSIIGLYEITAAFFFSTDCPHIIHNDDTFELPDNVYKGITIPLKIYDSKNIPKLCFFDQFYFHGPAKFFKDSSNIPTYYNKQIYDYEDVEGLVDTTIQDVENLFTHLKKQWLEGLSIHSILPWFPTSALIFDSVRLHCASNFRQQGISRKLGISIFTKLCDQ
jgi:hypothetical protein